MTIPKEILVQRKQDAQALLDHYLIKEFFCDIDKLCYDGIVNSEGAAHEQREQMYLMARAVKLFKQSFQDTLSAGTFQKELVIRKQRNIHE